MTWLDDNRNQFTCCQFATDSEIEADPDAYRCDECEFRSVQALLTPHDLVCLRLYGLLSRRSVRDLHLTELVFELEQPSMTDEDALTTLDKLEAIHQLSPQSPTHSQIQPGQEEPDDED